MLWYVWKHPRQPAISLLSPAHLGTKCLQVPPFSGPGALVAALALDRQNAVQGGRCDPQPLGHRNIIFHRLGDRVAAHHQHTGTPEQVAGHVDAVLVLLRHRIIEKQGQIQRGADRRKARLVHDAAVPRRPFHIVIVIAAPCGGNISKGSFHRQNLRN